MLTKKFLGANVCFLSLMFQDRALITVLAITITRTFVLVLELIRDYTYTAAPLK